MCAGCNMFETMFALYVLYAATILIWSSSAAGLRYVVISAALLNQGLVPQDSPLIIELRSVTPGVRGRPHIPDALVVSRTELASLVRWTPPGSTLVFCDDGEGRQLNDQVEQVLLELGITAVYWVDSSQDRVPEQLTTRTTVRPAKL